MWPTTNSVWTEDRTVCGCDADGADAGRARATRKSRSAARKRFYSIGRAVARRVVSCILKKYCSVVFSTFGCLSNFHVFFPKYSFLTISLRGVAFLRCVSCVSCGGGRRVARDDGTTDVAWRVASRVSRLAALSPL